nr:methyltransferase domain-containing protein [Actinomycetota bacterium]
MPSEGRRFMSTMRKVFIDGGAGGASPAFWDHAWDAVNLDVELMRMREGLDPVVRLVAERVQPGARVLEAGCGSGRVLAFLRELGCRAVGLDFAVEALSEARRRLGAPPMVAGDVTRLPFRDGSFDCVVSLGVVEHFEEGPRSALQEHRRVMGNGGLLLLSVPRLSPLKRWVDWRRSLFAPGGLYRSWRGLAVRSVKRFGSDPPGRTPRSDLSFYQYEFPHEVIVGALRAAGFAPVTVVPTGISLGLREIGLVRLAFDRLMAARAEGLEEGQVAALPPGRRVRLFAMLRRVFGSEQFSGPLERSMVRLLQLASGHMYFVVARAQHIEREAAAAQA